MLSSGRERAPDRDTFSLAVRKELCLLPLTARHCAAAELSAMLDTGYDNPWAARRVSQLLHYVFDTDQADARVRQAVRYPRMVKRACCKRAYARGCYIGGGTCSDPAGSYYLAYALPRPASAERLREALQAFKATPKVTRRKNRAVLYFKESDAIARVLTVMGANSAMLGFENVRVLKEMRNDVNRRVNWETANLTKTVQAAVGLADDIRYIDQIVGLSALPDSVRETARLRLAYETASLQEIGAMLDPPVGKSGVNHRLRKIGETAQALRENQAGGTH